MTRITMSQIYDQYMTTAEGEAFIFPKEGKLAMIVDEDQHTKHLFKVVSEYPLLFEEVEVEYDKLASRLAAGLDAKALMIDVLKTSTPELVIDVIERLENPTASVRSSPGCFKLLIGGKQGAPLELMVVDR